MKGIPIAVLDYLSSGLAGRFLKVGSVDRDWETIQVQMKKDLL